MCFDHRLLIPALGRLVDLCKIDSLVYRELHASQSCYTKKPCLLKQREERREKVHFILPVLHNCMDISVNEGFLNSFLDKFKTIYYFASRHILSYGRCFINLWLTSYEEHFKFSFFFFFKGSYSFVALAHLELPIYIRPLTHKTSTFHSYCLYEGLCHHAQPV